MIEDREHIEIDWLNKWNQYAPENVAIKDVASGRDYSYSTLFHLSCSIAEKLRTEFDISKGDRVAVLSTNKVEYIPLFFAIQRLGAICVPVNFRLTTREVDHIVSDSGAKLLIYQTQFKEIAKTLNTTFWEFEELQVLCNDSRKINDFEFAGSFEDPVMILYTSGTTGFPKGAVITHKMLFWNSVNTGLRLNLTEEDISLCFLPLFHTGGWNVLTTPLMHRGAKLLFLESFDPDAIVQLCDSENVSILFGVPTTMDMMARCDSFSQASIESVRYAIVGGEPMPVDLIQTWNNKNVPVRQGYGLTEFGPNVFSLNEEDAVSKIGSIGFPNFYIETKVVNSENKEVGINEIGELALRGPMCMKEYWNNKEATDAAIKNDWLHTGDLVRKDKDGYFYVVGRKKEMFISGGENVYPAEVEQIIHSFPAVKEVAVVGVSDDKWGEVGKAYVSYEDGFEGELEKEMLEELTTYCQNNLAKFKVPKHWYALKELPKSDSGKILKRKLL